MCAFSTFNQRFSSSHLLSRKLRFITTTNITFTSYKFNKLFSSRINFFMLILIYCPATMTTSNTPRFLHLIYHNLLVSWRCTRFSINIFHFIHSIFKQMKNDLKFKFYNILAKTLLSLVIRSGEIKVLPITSPKSLLL